MGKKLGIIGHPTRGNEVIKLLEMMGGKNCYNLSGLFTDYGYYFIGGPHNVGICGVEYIFDNEDICLFSLEEFLEKYPFKVGDKVHIYVQNDDIDGRYDIKVAEITSMRWNPARCQIAYKMKDINREFYKEEIKCKVEETQTKRDIDKSEFIIKHMMLPNKVDAKLEYEIIDGYEFDKVENGKIIFKPIKSKYPKTYKECCEIVNACPTVSISYDSNEDMLYNDEVDLTILALRKLIICCNAYWKIAGEEMGLDKPWKPDWENETQVKYMITTFNNKLEFFSSIHSYIVGRRNHILSFPTEEMRDAFYENFKDLIEQCKELL